MKYVRIATFIFALAALGAAVQRGHLKQDVSGKAIEKEATEGRGRDGKGGVNFEFGGDVHGTNPGDSYGQYLTRPEAVHSLKCRSQDKCETCDDESTCFHGETQKGPAGWGPQGWGFQSIRVSPWQRKTNFHYVSEIWVRCDSPLGQWYIWSSADRIKNGKVDIYVGGRPVRMNWRPPQAGVFLTLPMREVSERVEIKFYPNGENTNAPATCAVWVEAYEANEDVETCMDTKKCLKLFGQGGDTAGYGYELRNNNELQEKCLQNGLNTGYPSGLKSMCQRWKKCIEVQGQSQELLNLMKAAMEPYGSLPASTPGTISSTKCIDPSIQDPESWDCDCVGVWTRECKKKPSLATKDCLNQIMCGSPQICCGWKKNHCAPKFRCSSLVEKVAVEVGETAIMRRSGSSMAEEAEVNVSQTSALLDLDSSLAGKCAG